MLIFMQLYAYSHTVTYTHTHIAQLYIKCHVKRIRIIPLKNTYILFYHSVLKAKTFNKKKSFLFYRLAMKSRKTATNDAFACATDNGTARNVVNDRCTSVAQNQPQRLAAAKKLPVQRTHAVQRWSVRTTTQRRRQTIKMVIVVHIIQFQVRLMD